MIIALSNNLTNSLTEIDSGTKQIGLPSLRGGRQAPKDYTQLLYLDVYQAPILETGSWYFGSLCTPPSMTRSIRITRSTTSKRHPHQKYFIITNANQFVRRQG